MEAASGGYADIVKLLIDHGANVNATSRWECNNTVVHCQLQYGCKGFIEHDKLP